MGEPSTICGDYGYKRADGQPCGSRVLRGGIACKKHIGKNLKQAKADGALRAAIDDWGISRGDYIDPGDMMLRLIAQSARRVQRYADAIAALVQFQNDANAEAGYEDEDEPDAAFGRWVRDAHGNDPALRVLLAPDYAVTKDGERVYVGKKIAAITELESKERDRLALWCQKAIAAGLEERRVKAAEQQGLHLVAVIRILAEQLGFSADQQAQLPGALRNAVDAVFGPQNVIDGETA